METLEAGIISILAKGQVQGTGFLVAPDLAVTCAHVVDAVRSRPGGSIDIRYFVNGQDAVADVLTEPYWRASAGSKELDDVAFLHLPSTPPRNARVLSLGMTRGCHGHRMRIFGFAQFSGYQETRAEGEILGIVSHSSKRGMLQLHADTIYPGMSGSPVFDLNTGRVVGMVSEIITNRPLEWATTSETIQSVYPGLELHPPEAVEEYLSAVNRYCENFPYLTLNAVSRKIHASSSLKEMYIPLKARMQNDEEKGTQPGAREGYETQTATGSKGVRGEHLAIAEVFQITDPSHILIFGEPGTGKSTLLRQIAEHAWFEPHSLGLSNRCLPLLVPLRRLANATGSWDSRVRQAMASELALTKELPEGFFETWPEQSTAHWLILLDALDEVPDKEKSSLMQWLLDLFPSLKPHRVILTSRPSGYQPGELSEKSFVHYNLLAFTAEQAQQFARKWFGEQADTFLQETEHLGGGVISSTPLLLTLAAQVFMEKHTLPGQKATLYNDFTDIWMEEARISKGMEAALGQDLSDLARFALSFLALKMTESSELLNEDTFVQLTADYLVKEKKLSIDQALASGKRFLQALGRYSGVFVRRGDSYDFIHPTFREFLTAERLFQEHGKDLEALWQAAISRWRSIQWREIALFLLELASHHAQDLSPLVARIREQNDLDFLAAALARQVSITASLNDQIIQDILIEVHNEKYRAADYISLLGRMRSSEGLTHGLFGLLKDEKESIDLRLAAANALKRLGQTGAVVPILMKLVQNKKLSDWDRQKVIPVLQNLGQAGELLKLALDEQVENSLRIAAAGSLGKLGQIENSVSILMDLVGYEDEFNWQNSRVVSAFGELGQRNPLSILALNKNLTNTTRLSAAVALGESGGASEAAPILLELTQGKDDQVCIQAAYNLGKLGRVEEAVPLLLSHAQDRQASAHWRISAAESLGELGEVISAASVLDEIIHTDKLEQFDSEKAILALQQLQQVDILMDLVQSEELSASKRILAANALRDLNKGEEIVPTLIGLAHHEDVEASVRVSAVEILGKLDAAENSISVLLMIAQDEMVNLRDRRKAISVLREIKRDKELQEMAQDERIAASVRVLAAEAFGELYRYSPKDASPILLQLALDKQIGLSERISAAGALGSLGKGKDASSILLGFAQNDSVIFSDRLSAIRTLVKLGKSEEAVFVLLPMMRDENLEFMDRYEGVQILKDMNRADSLLELAQEKEIEGSVRLLAAEALKQLGWWDEIIPILMGIVRSENDDYEQQKAIALLGEMKSTGPLLELALDMQELASVRIVAAETLGKLGDSQQATMVLEKFAENPQVEAAVRLLAANALATLHHVDKANPALLELVQGQEVNTYIRMAAAETLGKLGHADDIVPILIDIARNDMMNDGQRVVHVLQKLVREGELLRLAQDEQVEVSLRISAASALGKLKKREDAILILLGVAQNGQMEAGTRVSAADALRQLGHTDHITPILLEIVRNENLNEWDREGVITVLQKLGLEKELVDLAQDEQIAAGVRVTSAAALVQLGKMRQASLILLRLAQDEQVDVEVRAKAAEVLGGLGNGLEAVNILVGLARNGKEDEFKRRTAIYSLRNLNRTDELLNLARDEQVDVAARIQAAEGLGKLGNVTEAVTVLMSLARNAGVNGSKHRQAINSLKHMKRAEELLNLARDEQLDIEVRAQAAEAMMELGNEQDAVKILVGLAQNEGVDRSKRWQAVYSLKNLKRAEELLTLVQNEQVHIALRVQAAEALGELEVTKEPTDILFGLAQNPAIDTALLLSLADTLGKLGRTGEAVSILLKIIRGDELKWEQQQAIRILQVLNRTDELLNFVQEDQNAVGIRIASITALTELGRGNDLVPLLLEIVRNENLIEKDSKSAISIFHKLGLEKELLDLAQNEQVSAWVRVSSAAALVQLGKAGKAGQITLRLSQDERLDVEIRAKAAEVLGELGNGREAANILVSLARNEEVDGSKRWQAIHSLQQLKRADELLNLARDEQVDAEMRAQAAEALGELGNVTEAVNILVGLSQNERVDSSKRWQAVHGLRRMERGEELLTLARDEQLDSEVRAQAAQALGELGNSQEAVKILVDLASNEGVDVSKRWQAIHGLRHLKRVDLLMTLARDEQMDVEIRAKAAEVLGESGKVIEAVDILVELVHNEGVDVSKRWPAIYSLKHMERADELMTLALDEQVDAAVRAQAAEVLDELGKKIEAVNVLVNLAQNEGIDVSKRWQAIYSLKYMKRVDELLSLSQDIRLEIEVRTWSTEAIVMLTGSEEAVNTLIALVKNESISPSKRWVAVNGLRNLQKDGELFDLAQDPYLNMFVRADSANALGEMGKAETAIALLREIALSDRAEIGLRIWTAQKMGVLENQQGQAAEASAILLELMERIRSRSWKDFILSALRWIPSVREELDLKQRLYMDVISSLGEVADLEAYDTLENLRQAEKREPIREAFHSAMERIRQRAGK